MVKAIAVCTNHQKLLDGTSTGCWMEELAAPYYIFKAEGWSVDVASMKASLPGGKVPMDPASMEGDFFTEAAKKFAQENSSLLDSTPAVSSLKPEEYDVVFFPGGHGPVFDGNLASDFVTKSYAAGKILCSVCHGPAVFVQGPKNPEGKPLVSGKKVTGFSNSEEAAVGKTKLVPWLLEGADWSPYVVADGRLVTGQNPQSSEKMAHEVVRLVKASG
eukprot:jgi/Astpho2/5516/Aster-x1298